MKKNIALLLGLSLSLTAVCALPTAETRAESSKELIVLETPTDSGSDETEAAETASVTMFRLYNPNSGEHFYTKDESEKDGLVKEGWNDEGVGWIAPVTSKTPVYRLYNANAGDHHYTLKEEEKDNLISAGWNFEGIGWYSDDEKAVPLYREYNPNAVTGTHNYTKDKVEHDSLVKAGWNDEGIGWYGIEEKIEPLFPDAKIGDIVTFGTYEQDNDLTNGPEPIEWQYIADRDGHKYLLSKYALDRKLYNDEEEEGLTWETCTLRAWLNNDFYNTAFTATEKQRIVIAHNENPDSYELFKGWGEDRGAKGGNDTDDRIFLLSWTEARDYFDGKLFQYREPEEENAKYNYNQKLLCKPTAYAIAQGIGVATVLQGFPSDVLGCCNWWLRSPGPGPDPSGGAATVLSNGSLNSAPEYYPETWYSMKHAIRPALLID